MVDDDDPAWWSAVSEYDPHVLWVSTHGVPDGYVAVHRGLGRPAVRCFRCGTLLDWESVEIDRIKPGAEGGRYFKNNIRPVCCGCNKKLEGEARKRRNAKRKARNAAARQRRHDAKIREHQDALLGQLGVDMDHA